MITQEYIDVTPELARKWLGKNERNRVLSGNRVKLLTHKIKSGQWDDTGDTIKFYNDGNIADGQTRLSAIAASGETVRVLVVFNISDRAALSIDQHRSRSATDAARISTGDKWYTTSKVAMVRLLYMLDNVHRKFSVNFLIKVVEENPDVKDRINYASENLIRKKGFGSAPFLCAVATAYGNVNQVRLEEFCQVVNTAFPKSMDDQAAITIREHALLFNVHSNFITRKKYFLRSQKAIELFCARSRIEKWIVPNKLIYPNFI